MYINDSIPLNYNYIAEYDSNYIVLVKNNYLESNKSYEAYIQYFKNSEWVEHIDNYKPKFCNATSVSNVFNYNMGGNLIIYDSSDIVFNQVCYEVTRDSMFFDRYDSSDICFNILFIVLLFAVSVNCLSSIIIRGGLFRHE